ncbi:protein of unknown function [Paraburkholderia dioscoreae]|uniref:Uncharacterized protein n=1 Tax=Paraburkholderia dioscoreae TaxID=2604047 RepID=A0A5Q4ZU45_9BURK|nr:protein of unknown function [Paraburkholderia dioscoreae]
MTRLSPLSLRRFGGTPFSITAASMAASPRRARSKTCCASSSNSGSIGWPEGGEVSAWSVNEISLQSTRAPHVLQRREKTREGAGKIVQDTQFAPAMPARRRSAVAEQLDQQAEHADQNGDTREQQHECDDKDQRCFEAAGCRHDSTVREGGGQRRIRRMRSAVAHAA